MSAASQIEQITHYLELAAVRMCDVVREVDAAEEERTGAQNTREISLLAAEVRRVERRILRIAAKNQREATRRHRREAKETGAMGPRFEVIHRAAGGQAPESEPSTHSG